MGVFLETVVPHADFRALNELKNNHKLSGMTCTYIT